MSDNDSQALVTTDGGQPLSLLTGSPSRRVQEASEIAKALSQVVEQQELYANISGRRHVLYEGWTTLGALVGVFPKVICSRPTENGWEARVEAVTLSGAVVGAAEATCSRDENNWKDRDDYALRSMAQTRAGAKALRMPLGFIMSLAGFDAPPAEEMGRAKPATDKQKGLLMGKWKTYTARMGGYDAIVEGYQADALPPEIMAILKESAGKLVGSIPDA